MKYNTLLLRAKYERVLPKFTDAWIKDIKDEFGEDTVDAELFGWYLREISNSKEFKKGLKKKYHQPLIESSNEEWHLTLKMLKDNNFYLDYILIKLVGEGNIEPHSLLLKRTQSQYLKLSDLFEIKGNWYLNVIERGDQKRSIKLTKETANELHEYIRKTSSRRGLKQWLFITEGIEREQKVKLLTYENYWHRFNTYIRPMIYSNHCVPKRDKLFLTFFKGAMSRQNSSFNEKIKERIA